MRDIVLIDVGEFHFTSTPIAHHPIHPNQIPREQVQATRHEPNAVNELQFFLNLLCLTRRGLVFIDRDVDIEADVLLLVFSNDINKSRMKLLPQFSDEQICVVTTYAVEDDRNVVGNCIPKVALSMSGTSVFPSVVAVIPHLFVPWFKTFQTDVALPHPTELSPLFQH